MKTPAEFDVFDCALDGINLIEASAGTGKTWNICGLYLRLLLERGLEVQKILVVTFTNAATAELRERIRSRIVETLAWLRDGGNAEPPGDPFVRRLVAAVERRTGVARAQMTLVLDRALQYFDEAAIFTIHGFCQRALAEASFSAGLPFALELVTDDSEMTMEAVHDFWRRRVADDACPPALAAHLQEREDTPEKFARLLARSLAKPLARTRWPAGLDRPAALDTAAVLAAYDAAAARLDRPDRDAIVAQVERRAAGTPQGRPTSRRRSSDAAAGWDDYFGAAAPLDPLAADAKLELLSASTLKKRRRTRAESRRSTRSSTPPTPCSRRARPAPASSTSPGCVSSATCSTPPAPSFAGASASGA